MSKGFLLAYAVCLLFSILLLSHLQHWLLKVIILITQFSSRYRYPFVGEHDRVCSGIGCLVTTLPGSTSPLDFEPGSLESFSRSSVNAPRREFEEVVSNLICLKSKVGMLDFEVCLWFGCSTIFYAIHFPWNMHIINSWNIIQMLKWDNFTYLNWFPFILTLY